MKNWTKRGLLWTLCAVVPVLYACSQREAPIDDPLQEQEDVIEQEEPSYIVPRQANIYLSEDMAAVFEQAALQGTSVTKSAAVNSVFDRLGIVSFERVFPADEFEDRTRAAGLHRWYHISWDSPKAVTKAAVDFKDVEGIISFRPVLKTTAREVDYPYNDPMLSQQWHYYNSGSGSAYTAGVDVNVLPVWKNYTKGSSSVKVAVIDQGVDINHPDLKANCEQINNYNAYNGSSKVEPGSHGTHVAGTIAAVNNNGIGVAGIAGGDYAAGVGGSKIISCQILGGTGSASDANAIRWAANNGAVVCNNSWGYDLYDKDGNYLTEEAKSMHEFFLQPNEGEYSDPLKSAIDYFNTYAGTDGKGSQTGPMMGGVCFFAAGNDAKPYGAPACYPEVVAVGAYGPSGSRASFSNYGDWVDVCAPGVGVLSTNISNNGDYSNAYASFQGTSMACPHVTGVAALVIAQCGGPGFTREMLIERLTKGANSSIKPNQIGVAVDALGAIQYGSSDIPAKVSDLSASASSNTVTVSWSVTGKGSLPAAGYILQYSTDKSALESSTAAEPKSGVSSKIYKITTEAIKAKVSISLELDFETTYYFRIYGYFSNLLYSDASSTASATTAVNNPPVITPQQSMENISIGASRSATFNFEISDPDGHSFTVTQEVGSAAETWSKVGNKATVTIKAPVVAAGTYTSKIIATDSYGKFASYSFTYQIRENEAPVVTKSIPNVLLHNIGESFTDVLGDYFSDPDGDALSYTVTNSAPSAVYVATNSGKLTATVLGFGQSEVTVTASDPKGKKASSTFYVLARDASIEAVSYPNPVSTTLYIATGATEQTAQIQIFSATGGLILETSMSASAFNPAAVDMSGVAPGRYKVIVKTGGKTEEMQIVKK